MDGGGAPYSVILVPERVTEAWLDEGSWLDVPAGAPVLVDATALKEAPVGAGMLASAAEQLLARAGRVAVFAPGPLAFGLSRQAVQLAGLDEGVVVAVFRERDAAVRWMLGSCASPGR